ncbi:MAG: hypothetical protein R3C16_08845 [Hyphomonadaceae bacterium]
MGSAALALLRSLDETAAKQEGRALEVRAATDVALYVLNEKREALATLEAHRGVRVRVAAGSDLTRPTSKSTLSRSVKTKRPRRAR